MEKTFNEESYRTYLENHYEVMADKFNYKKRKEIVDGFSEEDKANLLNSDKYFQKKDGMPTPLLLLVKNSKIIDKVEGLISKDEYIEFFDNNKII